jgi:glycine oxidase
MSGPPLPRRTDGPRTVVIGAGAIGLACALEIARGGGDVTVVDADPAWSSREAPRTASHAAAGLLGAFSEALHEGPGHHRKLSSLCAAALGAWRTLADEDRTLARFVRFPGALLIAHDDADAARVRRAVDRADAANAAAQFHDGLAPELDAKLFGPRVIASARLADEGLVAPTAMLTALAARVTALGGSILRGRSVAEIVTGGGDVRGVEFDGGGGLSADAVVVATGALAPPALKAFLPALKKLKPAKGALGVTLAPAGLATPEVVRSPRLYLLRDGAEIRFGATMEPGRADLDDDPEAIALLLQELRRTVPGAVFEDSARQVGAGLRPMSPDGAPLVGAHGPGGCFMAAGHGRNGWLLAPLTGAAIAAMIRGQETDPLWALFRPDRFG